MPVTEQRMGTGGWSLALDPATPHSVLDRLNLMGATPRLWATYVHTPAHWEVGEISTADLLAAARYCGVFISGRDRLSMEGPGLAFWLGSEGGGSLFSGVDTSTGGLDLEGHLDARVFNASNGLTKGSVNAEGTTFTHAREGGDTRWEMLQTLARVAPGGPYAFRINADFTVDVDLAATLWPTAGTPTVILTEEGGREGGIDGLYAILDLEAISGEEVRTGARVDWNDGTDTGTADVTLAATLANLNSGDPVHLVYLDWRPKRPEPPTERWRRVAAWSIKAQARANLLAQDEVNERAVVRPEITAHLPDLIDPWRFDIAPGNNVYLDDMTRGLINTSNEVYYRGEATHPTTGRVDEMTVPLYDGGGHYLRYYDGSAFQLLDLTRYVTPEEGDVDLRINQRRQFNVHARARPLTRRQRRNWYDRSKRAKQLEDYVEKVS